MAIENQNPVYIAEMRLLNYLWLNPLILDDQNYSHDVFFHTECQAIAIALDNITRNSVPLDVTALYQEAAKMDASVTLDLIKSVIAFNDVPNDYIKDITDFLRSIRKSVNTVEHLDKLKAILSDNVTLTPEILAEIKDEFEQAETEILSTDLNSIKRVMDLEEWGDQWQEDFNDRRNGKKFYFNEPILDKLVTDGPREGTGGLVVAASGMGKSTYILKLVNGFINAGIPCIYFSLEMGSVATYDRLVSMRCQIPYSEIVNPSDPETYDSIKDSITQERAILDANKNFRFCEDANLSIEDIKKAVVKFQEQIGSRYCIVLIDLITMVKDFCETRGNSLATTIELGINKMNALSKELGIHYIGTAQLNRSGETATLSDPEDVAKFRPNRAQVKNSGALIERVRYAVSLFRPKFYLTQAFPEDEEIAAKDDIVDAQILKQNNGVAGVQGHLLFTPEMFTMTEVPDDEGDCSAESGDDGAF